MWNRQTSIAVSGTDSSIPAIRKFCGYHMNLLGSERARAVQKVGTHLPLRPIYVIMVRQSDLTNPTPTVYKAKARTLYTTANIVVHKFVLQKM